MNFVTLTFDRDHTHAGQPIKRGQIHDIPRYTADWLIAHAIAHVTPATRERKPRIDATEVPEENQHELD